MPTIELVEKLRERADITFEEARAALEACNDDLLDAVILLERQGKVTPPSGGAYSGLDSQREARDAKEEWIKAKEAFEREKEEAKNQWKEEKYKLKKALARIGRFLLKALEIGNSNSIEVSHKGVSRLSCPVTVVVVLLILFPWVIVGLFLAGLLLGCRFRFKGPHLGRDDVNEKIEKAEAAADELKNSFSTFTKNAADGGDEDDGTGEDEKGGAEDNMQTQGG